MPKIRGIKPETWSDESFVELSPWARLLFIGMWNFACDNGHLEDRSKQIKMRVLPADEVNCAELLRELEDSGRIIREQGYITIPTLTEHQRIDRRYFTVCDKPGCDKPGTPKANPERETRRGHDGDTTSTRREPGVTTSGTPGDGDGDGECDGESDSRAERDPRRAKRAHQLPDAWQPTESHAAIAAESRVDIGREVVKFRDWAKANGSTKRDWDATFRNWLRNARPTLTPTAPPTRHVSQVEVPPDGLTDEETWQWYQDRRAQ